MSKTGSLLAAVMIAAAMTACGSPSEAPPQTTASAAPAAPAAEITIDNFTFDSPASVPAGATIAVKNADPAEHSVTADSGDVFNVEVEAGATATFTAPTEPGSYPYHCSYHPMMHGTLVVT
jgi:plastocyanin